MLIAVEFLDAEIEDFFGPLNRHPFGEDYCIAAESGGAALDGSLRTLTLRYSANGAENGGRSS